MKKLFISCPMKGRTEENIKKSMEKMHKLAEIIFDQELEVIPSYIPDTAPDSCNSSVWYLGESIKMMAEADFFIGIDYTEVFQGCRVEAHVAKAYGIRRTFIDMTDIMLDAADIEKTYCNCLTAC